MFMAFPVEIADLRYFNSEKTMPLPVDIWIYIHINRIKSTFFPVGIRENINDNRLKQENISAGNTRIMKSTGNQEEKYLLKSKEIENATG